MRRECGSTETYNTIVLDPVKDELPVLRNISDQCIGSVDAIHPLVRLDLYLDMDDRDAVEVLAEPYGFNRPGYR